MVQDKTKENYHCVLDTVFPCYFAVDASGEISLYNSRYVVKCIPLAGGLGDLVMLCIGGHLH